MTTISYNLENDLSWREAELAALKVQVAEATPGTTRHDALLRSLWALLYAHYEGFCKFAWDAYLEELEKTALTRDAVKEYLARLSLSKSFKSLKSNLSNEYIWNYICTDFPSLLKEKLHFEIKLDTESNLWPNVLRKNSEAIGLPYYYVDYYATELRALVSRRNDIAHGKQMVIKNITEYKQYESAAFSVMHELALAIVDAIELKQYIK
jgi:hypothetical protein